tara:strand:+ start:2779 stop:3504 length:726 start_codon:yes stop_codon:yes gene_type:complete
MKDEVPDKVKETLKEIGMTPNQAGWNCHGTYVLLHKALEKVAVHKKIVFSQPSILECNSEKKVVSLLVTGNMGDKSEWSIGEASPSNNKNSYPYAMAEKRAKDRVILKLVGLHGDVYAEDEADAFKEERPSDIKGGTMDNGSKQTKEDPPKNDPPKEEAVEIKDAQSDKVESVPVKEGVDIIKTVIMTFMPEDDIEALRRFKNINAEALKTLKELDAKAFGEVSTAFIKKADKIKSKEIGE